ncbi:MAG TPA: type II secretion system F family protein [Candidatus Elarobacter sp.]|jgi:tight adherence protein B
MAAVAPFAILLGALAAAALAFASFWGPIVARTGTFSERFTGDLEAAGMRIKPLNFVATVAGVSAALWIILVVLLRPGPLIILGLFAACAGLGALGGRWYLGHKRKRRIAAFQDQLEGALRTLAGGVRVGLGIRQALVLTSEQSREPSKTEFMRVVGLSNLGLSILDAFDQLALRMTNTETAVLARVVRVQAQTGGDLGSVLEGLAGTIRDRRRLRRRVSAVTAQGRATAWVLGLLPVGVGGFVMTQPELRDAALFTLIGQILLAISLGLDAIAIFCLMRIARIDP